jgi:hypothetical protein
MLLHPSGTEPQSLPSATHVAGTHEDAVDPLLDEGASRLLLLPAAESDEEETPLGLSVDEDVPVTALAEEDVSDALLALVAPADEEEDREEPAAEVPPDDGREETSAEVAPAADEDGTMPPLVEEVSTGPPLLEEFSSVTGGLGHAANAIRPASSKHP